MTKTLNPITPKQIIHFENTSEMMAKEMLLKKIIEDNPDLPYEFIKQAIIAKVEKEAGKLEAYSFG